MEFRDPSVRREFRGRMEQTELMEQPDLQERVHNELGPPGVVRTEVGSAVEHMEADPEEVDCRDVAVAVDVRNVVEMMVGRKELEEGADHKVPAEVGLKNILLGVRDRRGCPQAQYYHGLQMAVEEKQN